MRDRKRIEPFCARLARLWEKVPDQRFGQLMMNLLGEVFDKTKRDPFFIEDGELMIEFEEILKKWGYSLD